jgi:hypothetical protein
MNWSIHLMICIIFVFSTWVYFLKCEINELRRRLNEASGDHPAPEPVSQPTAHPAMAMTPAPAGVTAKMDAKPAGSHAPAQHRAYQPQAGIPTWKID